MNLVGYWVPCTPDFLRAFPDACGPSVRRSTTEPCPSEHEGHFHIIGHEHLMIRDQGLSGILAPPTPLRHMTSEPA